MLFAGRSINLVMLLMSYMDLWLSEWA